MSKTHPNTKQGWLDWASDEMVTTPADANYVEDVNDQLFEVWFEAWMNQYKESDAQDLREVIRDVFWQGHPLKANGFEACDPETLAELLATEHQDSGETVEACLEEIGYDTVDECDKRPHESSDWKAE